MTTPDEIHWVSHTQLSIARRFGGIKFNGVSYIYQPTCSEHGDGCDVLVRQDVLKRRAKAVADAQRGRRADAKARQGTLFEER